MNDLEKVEKLQEQIKAGNVKVADFMKYTGAPKQTMYNLRDDKVVPEKMTAKMVANLANLYVLLFPDESNDRSYKFGQLLAVMQAVAPMPDNLYQRFSKKPMDVFQKVFEQQMTDNIARVNLFEAERLRIMDKFTVDEFDNRPLSPLYVLGQGQEGYRLRQIGLK